jgi:hypothetical protein
MTASENTAFGPAPALTAVTRLSLVASAVIHAYRSVMSALGSAVDAAVGESRWSAAGATAGNPRASTGMPRASTRPRARRGLIMS